MTDQGEKIELVLDRAGIEALIPHREPFLLLDGLTDLEPGQKVVGIKNVRPDEYYLAGHFPGNPIMPGVLIVEALAQAGACALLSMESMTGKLVLFGGIDRVRFRRPVRPGDTLVLAIEIDRIRGPVGRGQGTATVNGELAADGRLTFAVVDADEVAFGA
ncbi:MAG: 3-hydroxyacyl-ACP dehydratase FabZ [Chloroflexota bacterium]|nr:3-hydroxyacyl-ACP dehydratase FabZ [Chloroflexota bacterium]MDP6508498.1 3-hydroxyacyl-ACP dehydratase FabZ [Chloroflexota bacterium]MDP6758458.1 3-hydroxyacyl-ACP dehydratase FabZ [Chloroflexota bacterium]